MIRTLDLKPKYHELVCQLLKQYIPTMTVWAYGSRVKGESSNGSDLDLVVLNSEQAPINLSQLKTTFSESNLPISVDILDWSTIPEKMQEEIKTAHIVIQAAEDAADDDTYPLLLKLLSMRFLVCKALWQEACKTKWRILGTITSVLSTFLFGYWFAFHRTGNLNDLNNIFIGILMILPFILLIELLEQSLKNKYRTWIKQFPELKKLWRTHWRDISTILLADALNKQGQLNTAFLNKSIRACDNYLKVDKLWNEKNLWDSPIFTLLIGICLTLLIQGIGNHSGKIQAIFFLFSIAITGFYIIFHQLNIILTKKQQVKRMKFYLKNIIYSKMHLKNLDLKGN